MERSERPSASNPPSYGIVGNNVEGRQTNGLCKILLGTVVALDTIEHNADGVACRNRPVLDEFLDVMHRLHAPIGGIGLENRGVHTIRHLRFLSLNLT